MSDHEIETEFLECASQALGKDKAGAALDLMSRCEQLDDLRSLLRRWFASQRPVSVS